MKHTFDLEADDLIILPDGKIVFIDQQEAELVYNYKDSDDYYSIYDCCPWTPKWVLNFGPKHFLVFEKDACVVHLFTFNDETLFEMGSSEVLGDFSYELDWVFAHNRRDECLVARAPGTCICVLFYREEENIIGKALCENLENTWFHYGQDKMFLAYPNSTLARITNKGLDPSFPTDAFKKFYPALATDVTIRQSWVYEGVTYVWTTEDYLRTKDSILSDHVRECGLTSEGIIWLRYSEKGNLVVHGIETKLECKEKTTYHIFDTYKRNIYLTNEKGNVVMYTLNEFEQCPKGHSAIDEYLDLAKDVTCRQNNIKRMKEELQREEEELEQILPRYKRINSTLLPSLEVCTICCIHRRTHFLTGCGHTFCEDCAKKMKETKCAFCSQTSDSYKQIYNL
jgi:hypothetical protein